jgi:hypothetical protein
MTRTSFGCSRLLIGVVSASSGGVGVALLTARVSFLFFLGRLFVFFNFLLFFLVLALSLFCVVTTLVLHSRTCKVLMMLHT